MDINHNFNDRKYVASLRFGGTRVEGTKGAIYETQTASERFFQRPDNDYKTVDSTRTTLSGTFTSFDIGKQSGNWNIFACSNYRSPGLDFNDIGFLQQTDNWNNWVWTKYRINKVTKFFRYQNYNIYTERNWDFGGVATGGGYEL